MKKKELEVEADRKNLKSIKSNFYILDSEYKIQKEMHTNYISQSIDKEKVIYFIELKMKVKRLEEETKEIYRKIIESEEQRTKKESLDKKLSIIIHPEALIHSIIEFYNYNTSMNYFYHGP